MWQKKTQLIHIDAIGMISKTPVKEFNIGAGYRRMNKIFSLPVIVGGYAFGDIKETPNKNTAYQITGGFEVLSTIGEFRVNGYLPVGKKEFVLSSNSSKEIDIFHDDANVYFGSRTRTSEKTEKILGGFDVEAGYKIPRLPVNAYAGFYHFGKDSVTINGGRARLEYKPMHWLIAGGEYSYDKERDHTWFVNLAIRLSMTGTPDVHSPFSLKGKMTQMPVRDIDIITADRESETEERSQNTQLATQVTNPDELEQAIKSGKPIAITSDIDFGGEVIGYRYASPNNPVKNGIIAGVKVTKQGGKITSAKFSQMKFSNYIVRQQAAPPSVITFPANFPIGLNPMNSNLAGALFPWVEDTEISNLVLEDWVSFDNAPPPPPGQPALPNFLPASGLAGYCKNCVLKNIVNNSDMGAALGGNNVSGIAQVADNTKIINCKNAGENHGRYSAGIAIFMLNNSTIEGSTNSGAISGNRSGGIAVTLLNDAKIEGSTNSGAISGNRSGGIARQIANNASLTNNTNSGAISGQDSGGIASQIANNASLTNNTNSGAIGPDSTGIIDWIRSAGNIVTNNTNTGDIAAGGSPINDSNDGGIDLSSNTNTGNPLP